MHPMHLTQSIELLCCGMYAYFGLVALDSFLTLTRVGLPCSEEYLFSKEGVTQGDLLSIFMHGIGTIPLIRTLRDFDVQQMWYADVGVA